MIKFLNPEILNYTPLIIVFSISLFIYILYNRRKTIKLIKVHDNWMWYVFQILKILAIITLFISLSLPVEVGIVYKKLYTGFGREDISSIIYNLTALHVILIDESKSMLYIDNREDNITRFEYALNFTKKYLNSLAEHDQVMIVGFSEDARKICIGNASYCRSQLYKLSPGKKYTGLNTALGYIYSYVTAAQYPAVIVIVSDGAYNYGGDPYDTIVHINKTGYPVLFVRIGLDRRANGLVQRLESSNIKVISVNQFTEKLIDQLAQDASREMRVKAFIAKKILEVKISYEDMNPYPTVALIVSSLVLFIVSRLEGY